MKIIKALALSLYAFQFTTAVTAQVSPQFMPLADSFEVTNPNAVQAINIQYDDIEPQRQLFHLFLPNTNGNYPLVVFIHGGGFTGSSPGTVFKDPSRRADVKYFLDRGFAFASVGYRLIESDGPDSEGVIKSLSDSKRALQFIRHHANDLHIDPETIGLMGSSAGAGTALWIATRSDMAISGSADPVLRESTRVTAVVAKASQSTYDIYQWETEIYDNFDGQGTNFTLDSIAEIMTTERLENFYGERLDSLYQIVHDPALIEYRQDVDMLSQLSADDPPLYISSQSGAMHPSDDVLHHSLHGKEIYETALAANLSEVKADIPIQSILTTSGESANEFLIRHLSGEAPAPEVPLSVAPAPQFQLAPNPATNYFSIAVSDAKIRNVEVLSLSGTILMADENMANSSQISTSSLSSGVYVVKIVAIDGSTVTKRLIVE